MKYKISREFGIIRYFRPPMGRGALKAAKFVLSFLPKRMRSTAALPIEKIGKRKEICLIGAGAGKKPLLLYLHGGGFVFRGAPYHFRLAKEYAKRTGYAVAFVDYRLAFDSPRLAPLDDCFDAYRFLLTHAEALGLDGNDVCLAGDSAGGYLCLALFLYCRKEGLPLPKKLMLVYPVVDPTMSSPSMRTFSDTPMWNSKCNAKMWKYLSKDVRKPLPEPLKEDLTGFPPVYLETAEYDCLHDEGVRLAAALKKAGVPCALNETRGTMHGFDICINAPTAQKALEKRIGFLNMPAVE